MNINTKINSLLIFKNERKEFKYYKKIYLFPIKAKNEPSITLKITSTKKKIQNMKFRPNHLEVESE